MATRYQLAEQALRLHKGRLNDDVKVSIKEVMLLVDQAASQFFVSGRINHELPLGDTIPDTATVAKYTATVTTGGKDKRFSTADLPIYPLRLERQMGVWKIYPKDKPYDEFIPFNTYIGLTGGIQEGYIEGLIGYELTGKTVRFSKDLTEAGITQVEMELLVKDPSTLGDYDLYPIPQNHEALVVKDVLELLSARPQVIDQTNDNRDQA